MGRGGDWPPKSFAEWMIGQNFRPKELTPAEGQKPVLRVELSEDEASGEDTLAVTYPGRRRRASTSQQAAAGASRRKVRFDGNRKPLKSALKKSSSSSSSDATLVDLSDDEAATFTDSSSDIDTSEDDAPIRRRKSKSKKGKVGSCKKDDHDDSSAAKDALPHPTCTCDDCVKGRKILKAVIKFEAKTKAAANAAENQSKSNDKEKQKGKKNKKTDASDTDGDTAEANTTENEKKPSAKGNKNKKQKQKQKTALSEMASSPTAQPSKETVNKDVFKLPQYPREMKPTLIMRPEARVMQIEHAIETPYDPRPNAFYDNGKGITRVYHGPKYANPNGKLYAGYNSGKATTPRTPAVSPVGPAQNPYTQWFPPSAHGPMHSFGPNPAMYAQMAGDEEAMRKAASQGLGLSGLPPPPVPNYFKEMQEEAARQAKWKKSGSDNGSRKRNSGWSPPKGGDAWKKMGSDKASKKGNTTWGAAPGWGNENNNSNSKPPTPAADPLAPADPSQDQNDSGGWGGGAGGDGAWGAMETGSKKGSQKDGGASPHDFEGWGDNSQPKTTFQRTSKDGGSQKQGCQKNWKGGEDNAWGANDNQNSGGWGDMNNNQTAWDAAGDNNGNGGGDAWGNNGNNSTGWGNISNKAASAGGDWGNETNNGVGWANGSTKAASAGGGDWGNAENTGTGWGPTSNKGDSPQQFNNDQSGAWNGPPGSFPRSAHNSRPGSNAGGNDGAWGSNGHDTKGKGSESHHSSPNEHFKGAFDWPAGSGPPPGLNYGGRGSRGGSKAGWQGPHPSNPQLGAFSGSQPDGPVPPGGGFYFHSNIGPSDWTNKPSDQATGSSAPPDWRNPDAAQNTGGKAMNW